MKQHINIQAQYENFRVIGRSAFCPRKGFYRILSTQHGTCLGKPAEMAVVNWKPNIEDNYTEDTFILQLESFKTGLSPLDTHSIVGKEIMVNSVMWYPKVPLLAINWVLKTNHQSLLDQINAMLSNDSATIDLDQTYNVDEEIENSASKDGGY